jgi:NAD(P)-dependent dehydrogenase (short-subunit alcohol dehydrogenase family)
VIVWLFGSTSPFAVAVKAALEAAGHHVFAYGRGTVDYTDPKNFVEGLDAPDMIIFNQHVSGGFQQPFLDYHPEFHRDYTLKPIHEHMDSVLLFKTYLVEYFKQTKFIFITSSIAVLKEHGMELLAYRMLRALEHQLIYAAAADGINALGICPGGLNSDNTVEYANRTVDLALSSVKPGKVYFANTGDEVPA